MKKFIVLCLFTAFYIQTHACDVCGAGNSTNSLGILPFIHKHFISVRFQHSSFSSKAHDGHGTSKERFQTISLWGRWTVYKRLQIFALLPYQMNHRVTNEKIEKLSGLSDATVSLQYMLFSSMTNTTMLKHALQVGCSLKLPTGKYDALQDNLMLLPNMQLGSGAWDVQSNLVYTLRYKKIGLNAEGNYIYRGTNPQGFAFGNRISTVLRFFTLQEKAGYILLPQIGLLQDYASKDANRGKLQAESGGEAWLALAGVDLYHKRIGLGAHTQWPLKQNLGDGFIKTNPRFNLNIFYLF